MSTLSVAPVNETLLAQEKLTWVDICMQTDLVDNSGVCALLPTKSATSARAGSSEQIALFYFARSNSVYALSNWDPIGKANVMYRGILGSLMDTPMVTSPLYKQHYSLLDGQCFEDETQALKVYPCRISNSKVQVAL